jgi:predicted acetyltransferase
MDLTLRPVTEDELPDFAGWVSRAFHGDLKDEDFEDWKIWFEIDRSLAAFDGDRIVGTAGASSYELTVPGGSLPAAGVTVVSVRSTHRRQGVLSAMMRHQLDDVRDRGESIAILWASESIIYGRYGYGMAAPDVTLEIERRHGRLGDPFEAPGEVQLLEREEAEKILPSIYEQIRPTYPGMLGEDPSLWQLTFKDRESHRDGFSTNRYVSYEEKGEPLGFLRYRAKGDWVESFASGKVTTPQLLALTPNAYKALWSHLLNLDLVETITAYHRPATEPLGMLLADPRRLRARLKDGLWLRIVDVPTALGARRYRQAGSLVLEVADPLGHAAGRFRLEGDIDGAEVTSTDADPDLTLDAAALGAAYLGGTKVTALADAGLIEGDPEAIRRADIMFGWDRPTWIPWVF